MGVDVIKANLAHILLRGGKAEDYTKEVFWAQINKEKQAAYDEGLKTGVITALLTLKDAIEDLIKEEEN